MKPSISVAGLLLLLLSFASPTFAQLDFGSCTNPGIIYETSSGQRGYLPADMAQFPEGFSVDVASVESYICRRLADTCGASFQAVQACNEAFQLFSGLSGQNAATAWNMALGVSGKRSSNRPATTETVLTTMTVATTLTTSSNPFATSDSPSTLSNDVTQPDTETSTTQSLCSSSCDPISTLDSTKTKTKASETGSAVSFSPSPSPSTSTSNLRISVITTRPSTELLTSTSTSGPGRITLTSIIHTVVTASPSSSATNESGQYSNGSPFSDNPNSASIPRTSNSLLIAAVGVVALYILAS